MKTAHPRTHKNRIRSYHKKRGSEGGSDTSSEDTPWPTVFILLSPVEAHTTSDQGCCSAAVQLWPKPRPGSLWLPSVVGARGGDIVKCSLHGTRPKINREHPQRRPGLQVVGCMCAVLGQGPAEHTQCNVPTDMLCHVAFRSCWIAACAIASCFVAYRRVHYTACKQHSLGNMWQTVVYPK